MAFEPRLVSPQRIGPPFAVGVLAVLGTLPMVTTVAPNVAAPRWLVVVIVIAVGVLGVGIAALVGSVLAPDVGLRTLAPERLPGDGLGAYRFPAAAGVGVAAVALGAHAATVLLGWGSRPLVGWIENDPLVVLVSVAGGVVAELVFRFGVMTTATWAVWTYRPAVDLGVTRGAVWSGILVAATAGALATFGVAAVGDGPSVATVVFPTVGGVVFGVLYRRYDLAAAVLAHAVASLLWALVATM